MKKINSHHLRLEEPEKPKCLTHKTIMYFDRASMVWACPIDECKVIAKRKEGNAVKATKPQSISLEIKSNADEEDSYVLVITDTDSSKSYLLDVSDNVEMMIDGQSDVTLCLAFNSVKRN